MQRKARFARGIGSYARGVRRTALWALVAATTAAPSPGPRALDVKIVMLERILELVACPEQSLMAHRVEIIVIGAPEVAARLSQVYARRKLLKLPVRVTQATELPRAFRWPAVAFLGASVRDRLGTLVKATAGAPVLTVSDTPGFAARGVAVNFHTDSGGRIRFEINRSALRRSRIQASYHLASIARLVGEP